MDYQKVVDICMTGASLTQGEEFRMSVKAELTCTVCKKAIKVGDGNFRIGDARIHVKCYEKMQKGKR